MARHELLPTAQAVERVDLHKFGSRCANLACPFCKLSPLEETAPRQMFHSEFSLPKEYVCVCSDECYYAEKAQEADDIFYYHGFGDNPFIDEPYEDDYATGGIKMDKQLNPYWYQLEQLRAMLEVEQRNDGNSGYGAHLTHWYGNSKPINIDAGAIQALINYYEAKLV